MRPQNKSRRKTLFSVLVIFALAQSVFAASNLPIPAQIPDLDEQIDGTLSPKYPNAGEKVTITLEAYGTNLNTAIITWYADDTEVLRGKGERSVSLVAPKLGNTTTVKAVISLGSELQVTKVFYINPQSVDIVWQADTYVPPFYKGKAMFSPQTTVTLVAMPDLYSESGASVSPSDIAYKWSKDFVVLGSKSGLGVRTLTYKGDILMQPVNIGLEATLEGGSTAKNFLNLSPTSPVAALYELSPIYGILYNKELASGLSFGESKERSVKAVPYFMSNKGISSNGVSYKWYLNGVSISVPETQTEMTFRNSEDVEGVSQIGLSISNPDNLLEGSYESMLIRFSKSADPTSL